MRIGALKINPIAWLAILPKVADLVVLVIDSLKDGRLSEAEIREIGNDFVAIVASVVALDKGNS